MWGRAFRRVEAGADAGDVAPAVSARATAGDPALMPRNEETLAAVPAWPAVARCARAGAPARDDRFWVRWPVGPPLPACVPFDDGVEGAGCAGLLLIGVVVAEVPAGGADEELVGAGEPLPDEALVSAGVAVGEDEDDEDEDEDDPFEEAGVPPELVLPLALPLPEPQPVWWPLSGEPEPWL